VAAGPGVCYPHATQGHIMTAPCCLQIKELIVRELNLRDLLPDAIDDQAPLFGEGLGLDSLDALQLAVALEEHFGVKIPEGQEARRIFRSVASITEHIEQRLTAAQ
jgi:acyl carrier protein